MSRIRVLVMGALGALICSGVLTPSTALPAMAANGYSIVDLGDLGGGYSYAYAVNNSGQVAGYSYTASGMFHAFRWTPGSGMQDLADLGGQYSYAYGINSSGQVVGTSVIAGSTYIEHAFLWTAGSGMRDLGTLGGASSSAWAINSSGQVVGYSQAPGGTSHAFLWTPGSGMQDLGTLGGSFSAAYGINDSGQVVGYAETTNGVVHPFLWVPGKGMQDLGTLGAPSNYYFGGVAMGINNSSQVTGYALMASLSTHAFRWTAGGGMQDLGPSSTTQSLGFSINSSGQTVGYYLPPNGGYSAALWTPGGGMQDIGALGVPSQAQGINDSGQIVGGGFIGSGGQNHAFLASPAAIPPTTAATATNADGSPYTSGSWTNQSISITLNATGANGTAIQNVTYSVNGGSPVTAGGSSATVSVSAVGTTTVSYHATDVYGNQESPQTFTVKIDQQAPATTASAVLTGGTTPFTNNSWTNNSGGVTVNLSASDEAGGSDVKSIAYSLNGGSTTTVTGSTASIPVTAEGTTVVTYNATDNAGNTELSRTFTVNIDQHPPAISVTSRQPAPNAAGWNNTPVTVTFSCSDNPPPNPASGVATAPTSPQSVNSDGADQSLTGTCIDAAGNRVSTTVNHISVDATPPQLVGSIISSPSGTDPHGVPWYRGSVAIAWACSDPAPPAAINSTTSGVASCNGTPGATGTGTITGEGAGLTATGTATDNAGNVGTGTSPAVDIDNSPPVTVPTAPNGWNTSGGVAVALNAHDGSGSGVKDIQYSLDGGPTQTISGASGQVTASGDGVHTLRFWSEDYAGNVEATKSIDVKIDSTAPTIALTGPAPLLPWYNASNAPVTLTYTCTDNVSGLASCDGTTFSASGPNGTGPQSGTGTTTVATEGAAQDIQAGAQDVAGNAAVVHTLLNIDLTPPTLDSLLSPAAPTGKNGWYTSPVTVGWGCADPSLKATGQPGSGLAGCSGPVVLSTDGAGQTVGGAASDVAGNTSSATSPQVNIDQTPPTITGNASSLPNANGWYNADVQVSWTCADNPPAGAANSQTSGVPSGACPDPSTIGGEGGNQSTSVSVADAAGNVGTGTYSVKIDRTAPVTTAGVPAANASGWYRGAVPVTLTASDNLSGVATTSYTIDGGAPQTYTPGSPFTVSGDGLHTVTFWSVDNAGNTESHSDPAHTLTLRIDTQPPSIDGAPDRTPDHTASDGSQWYNHDVTVSFTCHDQASLSGIDTCSKPVALNQDGAAQTVHGLATDLAGNSAHTTVGPINLDETPPTITATAATADGSAYNAGAWTNQDVTVTFHCTDATSGVDHTSAPVTLSRQAGSQSATGWCEDRAGNASQVTFDNINIDKTQPTISGTWSPQPNAKGWNNTPVTVSYTCDDPAPPDASGSGLSTGVPGSDTLTPAVSGVASCSGNQNVATEGKGLSVTGQAFDKAGNTASATVSGINIDLTSPTLSGTPTTGPNGANGWYTSPVTIHWTCADPSGAGGATPSGIDPSQSSPGPANAQGCPADTTLADNGSSVTSSATVQDLAGNQTTTRSQAVKIDTVPPVTEITAPSAWNTASVPVSLSAHDDTSGVAGTYYTVDGGSQQTYGGQFTVTGDGIHHLTYWSVDDAGNTEASRSATIKIDSTAPGITHALDPLPNGSGWNRTAVKVTFTCTDSGSGIASCDGTGYPADGPNGTGPSSATGSTTIGSEGKAQSVPGQAVDVAGNTANDSASVSIDQTPPTISGAPDRTPDQNGWYNAPVSIHWTYGDTLSGVQTAPSDLKLGQDGAGQTVSGTAIDAAGNTASATVGPLSIDQTPPTITGSTTASPNSKGWYNADVTIHWSCADNAPTGAANSTTSGIDITSALPATTTSDGCPGPSTVSGEGTNLGAGAQVSDLAGNVGKGSVSGIKIDRTAPVTTAGVPAANASGWYRGAVPVTLTASDNLSGVATTSYTIDGGAPQTYTPGSPFIVSGDGLHTVTFWSVDNAGNTEDRTATGNTITIKIDTTPPTISGARTPAANSNGWNNGPVTVAFTCADPVSGGVSSGIDTCLARGSQSASLTLSGEGANQSVTGTAMDRAGNSASTAVNGINIDLTPPTITYSGNAGGYDITQTVSIACTPADALSGVASSTCQNITGPASSFASGANTFSATATDKAGNGGSGSVTFRVSATFTSLCTLTQQYTTDPNEARSLCSKLSNAQAQATAGNVTAKNNMLGAYKNELSAQSGKSFTTSQVATLTRWTNTL